MHQGTMDLDFLWWRLFPAGTHVDCLLFVSLAINAQPAAGTGGSLPLYRLWLAISDSGPKVGHVTVRKRDGDSEAPASPLAFFTAADACDRVLDAVVRPAAYKCYQYQAVSYRREQPHQASVLHPIHVSALSDASAPGNAMDRTEDQESEELSLQDTGDWSEDSEGQDPPPAWFRDPITRKIMCDPVKCNDGRTYNRWSIIEEFTLVMSPFDGTMTNLQILVDDIDVRKRVYQKFPEQQEACRARRARHREQALEHAKNGEFHDALTKLEQVLQWARRDKECISARDHVQRLLVSGQPGVSPANPSSPWLNHSPSSRSSWSDTDESLSTSTQRDPEDVPSETLLQNNIWIGHGGRYFMLTKIGNRPCPRSFRGFPGYYFEVLWVAPEAGTGTVFPDFAASMGFKFARASHLSYGYGTSNYQVPHGERAEIWKCDENDSASEWIQLSGESWARTSDIVVGAGLNRRTQEVFFTVNGQLVWLLRGAVHLSSRLFPAWRISNSGVFSQFRKEEATRVNLGQRPFRFQPENMDDPWFREGIRGRLVEKRWCKKEFISTVRKRWGAPPIETRTWIETDAAEGDDGAFAKYFAPLPAKHVLSGSAVGGASKVRQGSDR